MGVRSELIARLVAYGDRRARSIEPARALPTRERRLGDALGDVAALISEVRSQVHSALADSEVLT